MVWRVSIPYIYIYRKILGSKRTFNSRASGRPQGWLGSALENHIALRRLHVHLPNDQSGNLGMLTVPTSPPLPSPSAWISQIWKSTSRHRLGLSRPQAAGSGNPIHVALFCGLVIYMDLLEGMFRVKLPVMIPVRQVPSTEPFGTTRLGDVHHYIGQGDGEGLQAIFKHQAIAGGRGEVRPFWSAKSNPELSELFEWQFFLYLQHPQSMSIQNSWSLQILLLPGWSKSHPWAKGWNRHRVALTQTHQAYLVPLQVLRASHVWALPQGSSELQGCHDDHMTIWSDGLNLRYGHGCIFFIHISTWIICNMRKTHSYLILNHTDIRKSSFSNRKCIYTLLYCFMSAYRRASIIHQQCMENIRHKIDIAPDTLTIHCLQDILTAYIRVLRFVHQRW